MLKIVVAGAAVYALAVTFEPSGLFAGLAWHLGLAGLGFPALLALLGFLDADEKAAVRSFLRRDGKRSRA